VNVSDFNDPLARVLPLIREELGLPTLEIILHPEFAAAGPASRLKIREAIIDCLKPDEVEAQTLRMLEHVPDPSNASVSISHNPSIGGFALTRQPSPSIGFDVEEISRLHAKAVARISKPEELSQAPARVWVAKEAAYKALRGRPKVITALTTSAWRSVSISENLSLWSCEVREDSHPNSVCRGFTVELSNTALGIFVEHR
jgi:hypothetical protein